MPLNERTRKLQTNSRPSSMRNCGFSLRPSLIGEPEGDELQRDDGNPAFYVKQVFALLAPAMKKAVTPALPVVKADPDSNNLVGTYRDSWEKPMTAL